MSQAPATPAPIPHRPLVFFGLIIAAFLQGYDNTMVAISLPQLQGPMSATLDEITWLLTIYLIAVAIAQPVVGPLVDQFGRRNVYLISVGGFAITSILAGSSDTLIELVFYRFLQGIFSATFQPISQGFVFSEYDLHERGAAMSWWNLGLMAGFVCGPLIGGYITEFYSWRLAYYLNVPISLISMFILAVYAKSRPNPTWTRHFSKSGYLILIIGLAALQFVLSRGERVDWLASPQILIGVGISAIALYLYVVHTFTATHPFIDIDLFRDRNFMISCVLFSVMGAWVFAWMSLISPFLQTLGGFPVLTAGAVLSTFGIANAIVAFIAGRVIRFVPPGWIIALGLGLMGYSCWMFSTFTAEFGQVEAFVAVAIGGIGNGVFFVSLSVVAFSTLPVRHTNVGVGFFSLIRVLGSGFGLSVAVVYLVRRTQANHALIAEKISPFRESFRHVPLPESWNLNDLSGLAALNAEATRQATLLAYIDDFRWIAILMFASIPLLALVRMPRDKSPVGEAAE
jgi:MFS transporter, DHA2 family, multidrug resistance protein